MHFNVFPRDFDGSNHRLNSSLYLTISGIRYTTKFTIRPLT
jgi:hypothetical protein